MVLCLVGLSVVYSKPVEVEAANAAKARVAAQLEERGGLLYAPGEQQPFTGRKVSLHSNGQKEEEGEVKAGNRAGAWTQWYADGQKLSEGLYKHGRKTGKWTQWYESGRKAREATYDEVRNSDGDCLEATYWDLAGRVVVQGGSVHWSYVAERQRATEKADNSTGGKQHAGGPLLELTNVTPYDEAENVNLIFPVGFSEKGLFALISVYFEPMGAHGGTDDVHGWGFHVIDLVTDRSVLTGKEKYPQPRFSTGWCADGLPEFLASERFVGLLAKHAIVPQALPLSEFPLVRGNESYTATVHSKGEDAQVLFTSSRRGAKKIGKVSGVGGGETAFSFVWTEVVGYIAPSRGSRVVVVVVVGSNPGCHGCDSYDVELFGASLTAGFK